MADHKARRCGRSAQTLPEHGCGWNKEIVRGVIMIKKIDKNTERKRRHVRVRKKISGTADTPRLCVFRSLNHIYAQVIDDVKGVTLCAASTMEKDIAAKVADMTKTDAAKEVGKAVGERAKALGIESVKFDRGGYVYMGRVQALADGAREAGLDF